MTGASGAPVIYRDPDLRREGGFAPEGRRTLLVLFVDFEDCPGTTGSVADRFSPGEIWRQLFDATLPNSLVNYFQENSYGRIQVEPGEWQVLTWLRLPQKMSYYGADSTTRLDDRLGELIKDTCDEAVKKGLKLAAYDRSPRDGVVDHLMLVHAGTGQEYDPKNEALLWSCSLSGKSFFTQGGVEVQAATIVPEYGTDRNGASLIPVGTYAHEFFHDLGAPDLYDPEASVDPVGVWDLMAFGSYGGGGAWPTHIGAFLKIQAGWLTATPLPAEGEIRIHALADPKGPPAERVYRFDLPGTTEYFLIENRYQFGFDQALPAAGLVIWHIDDVLVKKPWPDGHQSLQAGHYAVWVEDPLLPLASLGPWLKEGAVFSEGRFPVFSDTEPNEQANARSYDGRTSGLALWGISAPGLQMTARVGTGPVNAPPVRPTLLGPYLSVNPLSWRGTGAERATAVCFWLSGSGARVSLRVFTREGRCVRTLVDGEDLPAREEAYVFAWDGASEGGKPLPPGIYFLQLQALFATGQRETRVEPVGIR